jgi:hypothetical protein
VVNDICHVQSCWYLDNSEPPRCACVTCAITNNGTKLSTTYCIDCLV